MIECAILAVGEELLEGTVADTNSSFIAKILSANGFSPRLISVLPDDISVIVDTIRTTMQNYSIVITTGGLGPTFDDLTAASVAEACNVPLIYYSVVAEHIEKRLARLGVKINENHLRQAELPAESILFPNVNGTAYGFGVRFGNSVVISMPGVPGEMRTMFCETVLPFILKEAKPKTVYRVDLRFANIPESDVDTVIRNVGVSDDVRCIINAIHGEVIVKIRSDNQATAKYLADTLQRELAQNFIGTDGESPAMVLVKCLHDMQLTLSVAESCTGGLLGGAITAVPGSSSVFQGGVIAYANNIKANQLGVQEDVIRKHGAVSKECAIAMAESVAKLMNTDCAISVTGIAGPDGGTPEKPVGTVYICAKAGEKSVCRGFTFGGEREDVRKRAVTTAVIMLLMLVKE
jgi:nicotinamide-nucleotide amidase